MNYFTLLDMEERYDLDRQQLDNNYFALQRALHLDNKRDISEIDLNKAYFILKNDLSRAEYMLTLRGINISDPKVRGSLPPEELEQVWEELEMVEKIEDIKGLGISFKTNQEKKERMLEAIARSFEGGNLQEALAITFRLKYLVNLIDRIKLKIEHAGSIN